MGTSIKINIGNAQWLIVNKTKDEKEAEGNVWNMDKTEWNKGMAKKKKKRFFNAFKLKKWNKVEKNLKERKIYSYINQWVEN